MRRSILAISSLLLVTALLFGSRSANTQQTSEKDKGLALTTNQSGVSIDVFNSRFAVKVSSNARFNLGARPDASGGQGTNSWDLMYRWPNAPSTSFSTLRIDGADSIYGSTGTQIEPPTDINSTTNRSKWKIGDIEVTQTIEIVFNPQTLQNDVAKISYTTRNAGSSTHSVGLRAMIDTEINYNDGAPFRVPGTGIITTERDFTGSDVPDTFQTFFNVTDSAHVAVSTLRSAGATTPDRLVFARWPEIRVTDYDYTIVPGASLTSDSAYALYWNPTTLAPGTSRTLTTFYGLADLQVDLLPPLALGVSAPATLAVVNGQYSPNPFDVTATVFNNGNGTANAVAVTLNLPAGLSLENGSATQTIGDLPAGQERQVSWSVRAAPQGSQTVLTFSVTASATNAQSKTVQKQITLGGVVTPLVFIPGIAGSSLRKDIVGPDVNVWPYASFDDLTLDPTKVQPTIYANDVIRSVLGKEVYRPLIEMLKTRGGYREYNVNDDPARRTTGGCDMTQQQSQPTLFLFAYDWRLDAAINAQKLGDYIGCIQRLYPGTQVDILSHSMGGLVARRHILNNPNTHSVNKMITIAAPWLGAPKAINALETGQFFDGVLDLIASSQLKPLMEFFTGAHQLIPSRSYYRLAGTSNLPYTEYHWDADGNGRVDGSYTDYTRLVGMLDYRYPNPSSRPGTRGKIFHDKPGQDNWSLAEGGFNPGLPVHYFHVIGRQSAPTTIGNVYTRTRTKCNIIGRNCHPVNGFDVLKTYGDGTVPVFSATRLGNGHDLNVQDAELVSANGDHAGLANDTSVHNYILHVLLPVQFPAPLTLRPSLQDGRIASLSAVVNEQAYYLNISGSAAVTVTDDQGHSTAPVDGTVLRGDVPGVTTNMLDPETFFVALSVNNSYTIVLRTGAEPITLELTKGSDTDTVQAVRYLDLTLPANVQAMLRVTPQGVENLRYDQDSNGTFETSVLPTASVTGIAAQDVDPPILAISSTLQGNNSVVTITSSDPGSGIRATYYSLDGANYQTYTSPLSVNPNQGPVVYAFADDNVANRSRLFTHYPSTTQNQLDNAQFFVRQHYFDFLSRDPDAGGLSFWTNQITSCGSDLQCIELKRINVSAAYFLSIEFQETGYLVYRIYKAAYGNLSGAPVPVRFDEFLPDTRQIGNGVQVGIGDWQTKLANNKMAFTQDFVLRERFATAYPTTMTPTQFVDTLFINSGVAPLATDRNAAINEFGGAGNTSDVTARARAVHRVAENSTLGQQEFNKAFVLMQYFGYLRRNPNDPPEAGLDFGGFNFWLAKLNQFNGNFVNAEMVKAFIVSGEYRQRFVP